MFSYFFFFQAEDGIRDVAVTGVQTCALPISESQERMLLVVKRGREREVEEIFEKWDLHAAHIGEVTDDGLMRVRERGTVVARSEEHTSELQSRLHLVCRLLLEKKKKTNKESK